MKGHCWARRQIYDTFDTLGTYSHFVHMFFKKNHIHTLTNWNNSIPAVVQTSPIVYATDHLITVNHNRQNVEMQQESLLKIITCEYPRTLCCKCRRLWIQRQNLRPRPEESLRTGHHQGDHRKLLNMQENTYKTCFCQSDFLNEIIDKVRWSKAL